MTLTPEFVPALRTVNAAGAVTRGPTLLGAGNTNGLTLTKLGIHYPKDELLFQNYQRQYRWKFLGYRPTADLSFEYTDAAKAGFGLILSHLLDANAAETFGALQFTLFYTGAPGDEWRGMRVTSPWEPGFIGEKWQAGYVWQLSLEAVALIQTIGDWTAGKW